MADVVKVAAANKKEAEGDADAEPPSSYMVSCGRNSRRKRKWIIRPSPMHTDVMHVSLRQLAKLEDLSKRALSRDLGLGRGTTGQKYFFHFLI